MVLLGIEHLEQGRRRVAAEVLAELVDFVEQEQRVAHADLGQALENLARHGADVGAAVPTDFGFVTNAAECHAYELAVRCLGDRLAERSLADARGADQAEDGRLDLVDALLHREILDDALLDLV